VDESTPHHFSSGNRQIGRVLANIITRHERIGEKIDENVYPPESAIKPEFVRKIKKPGPTSGQAAGRPTKPLNILK